jgi:hypothetical protein
MCCNVTLRRIKESTLTVEKQISVMCYKCYKCSVLELAHVCTCVLLCVCVHGWKNVLARM